MTLALHDYAGLAPAERAALLAALGHVTSLGEVLGWGRGLLPPRGPAEILTQDEYTHDVVFELAADRWLVFDTT